MSKIVLFNKPYGTISQFREHEKHPTLANYVNDASLRIAGRLDTDSEGLMLLTDNGKINQAITHPKQHKFKTYLVQVEGTPTEVQIEKLCTGVLLKDGLTLPAQVKQVPQPTIWERTPPVRFRKSIPTNWLQISISEGKNRQVRRMTAHVGLPTLRLIRTQIADFKLNTLQPGEWVQINLTKNRIQQLLK